MFDLGVGIYGSLKTSKHRPGTPLDGLTIALQERVTRDDTIGQGNGMWGLKSIIDESSGNLTIESNGAKLSVRGRKVETKKVSCYKVGEFNNATLVDFQLDVSNQINIMHALKGYEPADFWLEDHEVDDRLYFNVKRDSVGTGTRIAAEKFKNIIFNSLKEEKKG